MKISVEEFLESQKEQVINQLSQNLFQLALMKENPKVLPNIQKGLAYNISMLIMERDRIQEALSVLEDTGDEMKALMIANTGCDHVPLSDKLH